MRELIRLESKSENVLPYFNLQSPKIYRPDRQFPAKYYMQNNLRMKTLKPMIKDAEPNNTY